MSQKHKKEQPLLLFFMFINQLTTMNVVIRLFE